MERIASDYPSSHMPPFPPMLEEELDTTSESCHTIDRKTDENNSSHFLEKARPQPIAPKLTSLHFQRDSASTNASDSTSSSPTTTASLTESTTNTETPITSPDTPASTQSLSSFKLAGISHSSEHSEHLRLAPAPRTLPRPSTSHKKPRNLKGLAVDTSSASAFGRAVNTASLPIRHPPSTNMISEPASPAFVKPPLKQPKRKGSTLGLSIVTPATNNPPPVQQLQDVPPVPPTPSLVRPHALRHFPSSPALPLASPSMPPEGGMRLPPLATRRTVNVGFAAPLEKDEDEPNFDVPQSAEIKPKSYPDGPICIYDPHVYLYCEPSAPQASQFGVVLNAASEVANPFTGLKASESAHSKTTTNEKSDPSPTTPKAGDTAANDTLQQPEYIHVPWEHNTDIVPDLFDLVKLVDERVQEGKKVLIHCQLGVSRSASLIVAYGLYKNPSMTVQEAYDAVKRRSKYIGPNMNLIMQLQEFRNELLKQSAGMPSRGLSQRHPVGSSVEPLGTGRKAEPTGRRSQDREATKTDDGGPRSAPLPPPDDSKANILSIKPTKDAVTPGPSSAPSGFAWPIDIPQMPAQAEIQQAPRNNSLPTSSLSLPPLTGTSVPEALSASSQPSTASSPPSHSTQPSSSAASPETFQAPTSFSQTDISFPRHPPPSLKPISLPINHISRFHASNKGISLLADSPRASEFAMSSAQPPTPDETFGLTSPRVANFQGLSLEKRTTSQDQCATSSAQPLEDKSISSTPEVPQRHPVKAVPIMPPSNLASLAGLGDSSHLNGSHESHPSLDSITSPRSSEFAMGGIGPPKALRNDESYGLTSPRENLTFEQQVQLPHRQRPPPLSTKKEAAFASLHSPTSSSSNIPTPRLSLPGAWPESPTAAPSPTATTPIDDGARDRRSLRSKLGMSTSSSYDMRSEYVLAAKARELVSQPSHRPQLEHRDSFVQATQDDMADALMSPRATEFTRNPFADALGLGVEASQVQPTVVGNSDEAKDPRSPVQKSEKGSSPIVRNIADVFEAT